MGLWYLKVSGQILLARDSLWDLVDKWHVYDYYDNKLVTNVREKQFGLSNHNSKKFWDPVCHSLLNINPLSFVH